MNLSQSKLPNGQIITYLEHMPKQAIDEVSIVFIHGNFSQCLWWQEQLYDQRFQKYHMIAVNLRGFGQSTYNNKCSSFQDWAEDVVQLFKIKSIKRVYLLGWSFGGAVSMKVAQLAPKIVEKIVLTCSLGKNGFSNDENRPRTLNQILKQLPTTLISLQLLQQKNIQGMRQIFQLALFGLMEDYPQEKKKMLAQSPFKQRCYLDLMVAVFNSDIKIQNIKANVLMIHGGRDLVVHPKIVMSTGQHFGNFELWQQNGHMIPIESTQKYNTRVLKFFAQPKPSL